MSALALGLANVSPRFLTDHNFLRISSKLYSTTHLFNQVSPSEFAWVSFSSLHIQSIRAIYSDGVPLCAQPLGRQVDFEVDC